MDSVLDGLVAVSGGLEVGLGPHVAGCFIVGVCLHVADIRKQKHCCFEMLCTTSTCPDVVDRTQDNKRLSFPDFMEMVLELISDPFLFV